ncbi:LysM peptidoglycan-binding domain-containing protein [Candidatus Amarobacter glycogenicus]|uniref:LysM peptidoglycan-binding domain-containing protein n=1 Tax=Candidatus Amarobacter glycogenicus TaxID=3140699 RepID=UPI0031CC66C9
MTDLAPVAQAVASHFQAKGFEVKSQRTDKGWHVSVSKADTFKVVMGTKTALNVELEPKGDGTEISAGIGVFGQQSGGLGSIMAGPLMITQLWGMVQQSKLDDEALAVAEKALQDAKSAGATSEKAAADRATAARAAAEMQAEMEARRHEEEAATEGEAKAQAAAAAKAAKARMEAEIAARVQQEAEAVTRAQAAAAAKARMEAEITARVQAAAEAAAKAEAETKAKAEAAAQAREALGAEPQPVVGTRGVLGGSERTHVVVAGDSLYKIAAHFYGNGNRWPEIFEANKDIIKNPRIIRPGQKLRIP